MTNEEMELVMQLEDKPEFKNTYGKSSDKVKEIFRKVVLGSKPFCHAYYPTNKPDYRLNKKGINFCLMAFMLREKCLRVHLRTDKNVNLVSNILQVKPLPKHNYNGWEWQEIKVFEIDQVDEAIRIIGEVYNNFDRVKHY
jgi:hypothetical protein